MNDTIIMLVGLGGILAVTLLLIDDRIIRDICRREGKPYSIYWLNDPSRHRRVFQSAWWHEAQDAGLYGLRVSAIAAYSAYIIGILLAWLLA